MWLYNIPLRAHATLCLLVHPLEDRWAPSTFCLLWTALLRMWLHMHLSACLLLYTSFILFSSSSCLLFSHRCPRVNAGEINSYLLGFKQSLSPKLRELVKDPPHDQAGQDIWAEKGRRKTECGVNTQSPVCAHRGHGFVCVQSRLTISVCWLWL